MRQVVLTFSAVVLLGGLVACATSATPSDEDLTATQNQTAPAPTETGESAKLPPPSNPPAATADSGTSSSSSSSSSSSGSTSSSSGSSGDAGTSSSSSSGSTSSSSSSGSTSSSSSSGSSGSTVPDCDDSGGSYTAQYLFFTAAGLSLPACSTGCAGSTCCYTVANVCMP